MAACCPSWFWKKVVPAPTREVTPDAADDDEDDAASRSVAPPARRITLKSAEARDVVDMIEDATCPTDARVRRGK